MRLDTYCPWPKTRLQTGRGPVGARTPTGPLHSASSTERAQPSDRLPPTPATSYPRVVCWPRLNARTPQPVEAAGALKVTALDRSSGPGDSIPCSAVSWSPGSLPCLSSAPPPKR
jgi:hypothetical protein